MKAEELLEQLLEEYHYDKDAIMVSTAFLDMFAKEYARLKCKELLEIVAEKAKTKTIYEINDQPSSSFGDYEYDVVDKDTILNAVDLNSFIS